LNGEALKPWDLYTKKLLSGLHVPDADIIKGASSEELRVFIGESDSVDALVMASVTKLGVDLVAVAPVDGGLAGSTEEVGGVSCQSD
jgi:hypothetical protein